MTMTRTLPNARDEFIKAMYRDTIRPERPRLLAVLDAMIEWSIARPDRLRFREDANRQGVVRFERVGSNQVFWAAYPRRQDAPDLQLLPRAGSVLSAEERRTAMETLNAHSRQELTADDPLQIGFGALKNQTTRTAVLALMDQLLAVT